MSSRSFSRLLTEHADLEEAVASYMASAAEKLRRQDCLAGAVQVYIRTNIFKPDIPQYQQAVTLPLPAPTDDTRVLTRWAFRILKRICRPGYAYHKAGIMLLDLVPIGQCQPSLLSAEGEKGGRPQAAGRDQRALRAADLAVCRGRNRPLMVGAEGQAFAWIHDKLGGVAEGVGKVT